MPKRRTPTSAQLTVGGKPISVGGSAITIPVDEKTDILKTHRAGSAKTLTHSEFLSRLHDNPPGANKGSAMQRALGRAAQAGYPVGLSVSQNQQEIITYTDALIVALQEALDYDPVRHHNLPRPSLYAPDPKYKTDIKTLTKELRRLNDLLEKRHEPGDVAWKVAESVGEHLNVFAKNYVPTLGKGSAYLTLAVITALLARLGLPTDAIAEIMKHIRPL